MPSSTPSITGEPIWVPSNLWIDLHKIAQESSTVSGRWRAYETALSDECTIEKLQKGWDMICLLEIMTHSGLKAESEKCGQK